MYINLILPGSCLPLYHILKRQSVAVLKKFLCKLYHDIWIENVFQSNDNLYYVYVQNSTMLLDLSREKKLISFYNESM